MYRVILGLSASALAICLSFAPANAVEVYLFKGAGDFSFINKNMHFSRGLERIRDELKKDGIHAVVRRHGETASAMREIKKRKPESVAFVGHSMGALASMSLAKRMKALGIKVAYVGTLDIPGPIGVAGRNVEKAENYYSITPIYGLLTNAKKHPDAKNIHVFGTHTTMDDSKKVFNGVVSAVREIHASEQNVIQQPAVIEEQVLVEATPPAGDLNKVEVLTTAEAEAAKQQNLKQITVASRAKPISQLQDQQTVSSIVPPVPQQAPINILARPIGGASSHALEQAIPVQQNQSVALQPQVVTNRPSKLGEEPVSEMRTSRLLDRVRSVLKRNGSVQRRQRQPLIDR